MKSKERGEKGRIVCKSSCVPPKEAVFYGIGRLKNFGLADIGLQGGGCLGGVGANGCVMILLLIASGNHLVVFMLQRQMMLCKSTISNVFSLFPHIQRKRFSHTFF